jgi:hypothetical protein
MLGRWESKWGRPARGVFGPGAQGRIAVGARADFQALVVSVSEVHNRSNVRRYLLDSVVECGGLLDANPVGVDQNARCRLSRSAQPCHLASGMAASPCYASVQRGSAPSGCYIARSAAALCSFGEEALPR